MKFITALSALSVVTAGSLRNLASNADFESTNDFFANSEGQSTQQQSSFSTFGDNNGDSKRNDFF